MGYEREWVLGETVKGVAAWNPDLKMDLAEMVKKETQVGVDAVSVLEKETEILPQYSNKDNTLLLSSFYLCQTHMAKRWMVILKKE